MTLDENESSTLRDIPILKRLINKINSQKKYLETNELTIENLRNQLENESQQRKRIWVIYLYNKLNRNLDFNYGPRFVKSNN